MMGRLAWVLAPGILLCAACLPLQAVEATDTPVCSRHDLNRDGYLDGREYYRLRQRVRARRGPHSRGVRLHDFGHIDADGNGLVSQEEMLQRIEAEPR